MNRTLNYTVTMLATDSLHRWCLTISSFHPNIYKVVHQIPAQEPNDQSTSAQANQGPATSTWWGYTQEWQSVINDHAAIQL